MPEPGAILIVEDEPDLLFLLRQNFQQQGYRVVEAASCAAAREALRREAVELLLLDVNLPDGTGFDLLQAWREEGRWQPAVFLTARADEADRLRGFAVGGDDYVCKPFSMAELVARVGAIMRRSQQTDRPGYSGETFELDYARYRLTPQGGEPLTLTYLECELLRYLIEREGTAISRNELLNEVWGYDKFPSTRTVDTHVLNLRKKLEPDPSAPRHLLTVHGVGYKFVG